MAGKLFLCATPIGNLGDMTPRVRETLESVDVIAAEDTRNSIKLLNHFGISTPRYSQAFKNVGQPVAYQNIQAGDVVVYPGHVAIYIGNGCIVEAQSTRAGITNTRSVNCHTITAIRRLV